MRLVSFFGVACGLALPGCGGASGTAGDQAEQEIVCTVAMVADVVRQVAGDALGTVVNLVGEGVDPHLYKPTRNDVVRLERARAIFYVGLMLEGKMGDLLVRMARNKPVFAVTERMNEDHLLEPPGMSGQYDPHVWMDVAAWSEAVAVVGAALAELDPARQDDFFAAAERYRSELAELDAYVRRVIGSIPSERRVLITAHDAFNYFGRAYDIRVEGIQGISTESEAGLLEINRLVDLLISQRIPAVFVETSVADKNVRALIEGARSRGHEVRVGGELFSDAMGAPGTYEGTYIGMLDHNATVIARALGGDAPPRGLHGRLSLDE